MSKVHQLVDALRNDLAPFGYCECADTKVGQLSLAALLAAPKGPKRMLCAVAGLPGKAAEPTAAAAFLNNIRRGLTKRFVRFPWPGRLGTYVVLMGDKAACEALTKQEGNLIDFNNLHVNVLLGVVVVDLEAFRWHSDATWGLMDTDEQFRRIQAAVEAWCRRRRGSGPGNTDRFNISLI